MAIAVSALLAIAADPVYAQAQAENVATARRLAYEGIDAVEKGDCETGVDLLARAEALHHAAIHLQYLARCHERAGNLVQATETWRRLLREPLGENTHPVVHAAVDEARSKLETSLPLLGTTTLRLEQHYKDLQLVLDGRQIDSALIGVPQVLDPGNHELSAQAPHFLPKVIRWSVEPGETREIRIELAATEQNDPDPAAVAAESTQPAPGSWLTVTGYVALAAGGLSAAGATWALLQRNTRRQQLETECGTLSGACAATAFGGDRERAERQRNSVASLTTWSNVLYVGAGALVTSGVGLLLFGPASSPAPSLQQGSHSFTLEALVTPSQARLGLGARF